MLATAEQVKKAMELTIPEIRQAMRNGGYPGSDREFISAEFLGFTGLSFVYRVVYPGEEDEPHTEQVYINLRRAPLSRDFEYYGIY